MSPLADEYVDDGFGSKNGVVVVRPLRKASARQARVINRVQGMVFTLLLAVVTIVAAPSAGLAQIVTAADREAMVRLRVDRGGTPEEVDALIRLATDAAGKGLPAAQLANKIREGLAKGAAPAAIDSVIRRMTTHIETADRLIREMMPAMSGVERERSVTLVAEAFGTGVTADEVRDLRRLAQTPGQPALTADSLGTAAKGLALIKDARLPAAEGTAVIVEALRQGYRSSDVLDLGREVKRREIDYRTGRASLQALREAMARGERPEQLFRDTRTEIVERPAARPAAARPDTTTRPDRPTRPDSRPESPQRPETTPARLGR